VETLRSYAKLMPVQQKSLSVSPHETLQPKSAQRILERTQANIQAEIEEMHRRRDVLTSIAQLACEAQEDIDRILQIFQANDVTM
jgi:hypothetical protein